MFLVIGIICFLYHVSSGNSGYYDIETVVYYLKLIGDIILMVGGSLEIYLWKSYKLLKTNYSKSLTEHHEGKIN